MAALAVMAAGWVTLSVPVTGPQLFISVTLQGMLIPGAMPINTPVALVTPLKVYDNGGVPPKAVMVTVAVPPLQSMGEVTAALAVMAAGWVTLSVPVTGPQLLASVTLQGMLIPGAMPINTPVALVTPLNVYDNGGVPPKAVMVTVAVPPLQRIGDVMAALAVIAVGWVTLSVPVTGPQLWASVTLQGMLFPAEMRVNTPVALVTPLNV